MVKTLRSIGDANGLFHLEARGEAHVLLKRHGVLLRCYDYNDFFVGARNSGHASDMISGVIAAAEWANVSGANLLSAIAIGYEVGVYARPRNWSLTVERRF